MHLECLELNRFRNLASQRAEFPSRVTLIVGPNGQGKTSLIEAVYLLAHAKSFRTSKIKELVCWAEAEDGVEDAFVSGKLQTDSGSKELACKIRKGKRQIFLNGKKLESASSFYGQLNCVVFTPDDLQIVKGAPGLRRSFLDRILAMSDQAYVEHLVAYQRALKNRNKLLGASTSLEKLQIEIEPWNTLLIDHGVKVLERRRALAETLTPLCLGFYRRLLEDEVESIALRYESHFLDSESALCGVEELFELYRGSLERDLRAKSTSLGVHRDDIVISIDTGYGEKDARQGASQGQSRSIALSLKLSAVEILHERTSELPILLLDDVESELDSSRKQCFYRLLADFETQVIITSTSSSPELLEACPELDIVEISGGEITR